jgi:uncharacterized protein (TIGR03083 family)
VDPATHLDYLAASAAQLGDAAGKAALSDPVPGCPDWTVRDLVGHVGMVHRWATTIVAEALERPSGETAEAPADPELLDWYAEGHLTLLDTLQKAPADLACFAFLPAPSPLAFWARRQAHETTIHCSDAKAAAGVPVTIDDELARDGIEEILLGFGKRKREFEPGTIRLKTAGVPGWLLALSAEGAAATPDDSATQADVTVSGDAGQVYLWLWNRPAEVTISGDSAVAERWQKVKVRWG